MDVHYEKNPNSIKTVEEKHIEISKVTGGFQNDSDMKAFSEKFKNDYSIINHNNMLLEFIPKGYNKAVGIDRLIKEIGIPKRTHMPSETALMTLICLTMLNTVA